MDPNRLIHEANPWNHGELLVDRPNLGQRITSERVSIGYTAGYQEWYWTELQPGHAERGSTTLAGSRGRFGRASSGNGFRFLHSRSQIKRRLFLSGQFGSLENRVDHETKLIAGRLNDGFGLARSLLALLDFLARGVDGFSDAAKLAHGRERGKKYDAGGPNDHVAERRTKHDEDQPADQQGGDGGKRQPRGSLT